MSICTFCNEAFINDQRDTLLLDRNNVLRPIGCCKKCSSLSIMDEKISTLNVDEILERQVELHNDDWENETNTELTDYAVSLNILVDFLTEKFNLDSTSNIIEVGSGRGGLIKAFLNSGFYEIKGCEPSEFLYNLAIDNYNLSNENLLNCISSDLFNQIDKKVSVDLIVYWHSLEHIPSALSELKSASSVIHDNGAIIIQVPLLYKPWIYDEHLHFMTEKTLEFIESQTSLYVFELNYDYERMFMTVIFKHKNEKYIKFSPRITNTEQLYNFSIERLHKNILASRDVLDEKIKSNEAYKELVAEKINTISSYETLCNEKDLIISKMLDERIKSNAAYEVLVKEKFDTISSYEILVKEKIDTISSYESLMIEKMDTISSYESLCDRKNDYK